MVFPIAQRESGEKGNENYRKLFFRENKLVGVLMVGSPKGRKKLVEIVKNQQGDMATARVATTIRRWGREAVV